jgi:hypothetical protein
MGSIYPTGTRFHIPDFSLISGSPGDQATTPLSSPEALVLERLLRDLGITGPPRGAFTLLGLDSIYQISL